MLLGSRTDVTRGEYQTRCTQGVCWGCVWTISADLEATCCWRLCFCPKLNLTLQKEFGQCSHVQNGDWCAIISLLRPVAALFACELARGGPHTLPSLIPQQFPPKDSTIKGRPFPREVVQIPEAVRTRCANSLKRDGLGPLCISGCAFSRGLPVSSVPQTCRLRPVSEVLAPPQPKP